MRNKCSQAEARMLDFKFKKYGIDRNELRK